MSGCEARLDIEPRASQPRPLLGLAGSHHVHRHAGRVCHASVAVRNAIAPANLREFLGARGRGGRAFALSISVAAQHLGRVVAEAALLTGQAKEAAARGAGPRARARCLHRNRSERGRAFVAVGLVVTPAHRLINRVARARYRGAGSGLIARTALRGERERAVLTLFTSEPFQATAGAARRARLAFAHVPNA